MPQHAKVLMVEGHTLCMMMQALQWVTLGSIVAYLGYNTGGMFVTGEAPLPHAQCSRDADTPAARMKNCEPTDARQSVSC